MDPNQLMQIIQMLSQQQGGGGMGMGGMGGMGMGGTAMPQMALPQMQAPTGPATRVIPAAPMAPMGGGHSLSASSLLQGAFQQPQQPSTQTGTPLQSVQGPGPSTLAPAVQAGITQMQSPPPLQAAQAPDISQTLGGITPAQSRLGPSGDVGSGIGSTLGTFGTNVYNNFLAQFGLGPKSQTGPASKVNEPFSPAYNPGHNYLHLGSIIAAAIGAAA